MLSRGSSAPTEVIRSINSPLLARHPCQPSLANVNEIRVFDVAPREQIQARERTTLRSMHRSRSTTKLTARLFRRHVESDKVSVFAYRLEVRVHSC